MVSEDKYLFLKIIGIGFIFLLLVVLSLNLYYNSHPRIVYIEWVESFPDENNLKIRFKVVNPLNTPFSGYFMIKHDCLEELNKNITGLAIIEPFGEKIYNTEILYIKELGWNCDVQSEGALTIYVTDKNSVTDYKTFKYNPKENNTN